MLAEVGEFGLEPLSIVDFENAIDRVIDYNGGAITLSLSWNGSGMGDGKGPPAYLPHSVRTCNERASIRHVPMRRGSVLSFWEGLSATEPTAGRLSHRGGQRSSRTGTTPGALLPGPRKNCELVKRCVSLGRWRDLLRVQPLWTCEVLVARLNLHPGHCACEAGALSGFVEGYLHGVLAPLQ